MRCLHCLNMHCLVQGSQQAVEIDAGYVDILYAGAELMGGKGTMLPLNVGFAPPLN